MTEDVTFCRDPTHDQHCDCGAEPDRAYERRVEARRGNDGD